MKGKKVKNEYFFLNSGNITVLLFNFFYMSRYRRQRERDLDVEGIVPPIGIGIAKVALCRMLAEAVVHMALFPPPTLTFILSHPLPYPYHTHKHLLPPPIRGWG